MSDESTLSLEILGHSDGSFGGLAESMKFNFVILLEEDLGDEEEVIGIFLIGDLKVIILGVEFLSLRGCFRALHLFSKNKSAMKNKKNNI
jgi:hypothetical protein